ncbi:hypothetical protein [Brevibacillus sp. HB2.2]|uniref:hypothetical protein n=2 Tax=Brevibacillus TaxID=55080 RepID=UPI00156BA1AC|nr:hypothetical protein [Brevibacillus sp. HB2.2]NRS51967.1 hypothetical protein [Brevibacillus sp. HB2.2]
MIRLEKLIKLGTIFLRRVVKGDDYVSKHFDLATFPIFPGQNPRCVERLHRPILKIQAAIAAFFFFSTRYLIKRVLCFLFIDNLIAALQNGNMCGFRLEESRHALSLFPILSKGVKIKMDLDNYKLIWTTGKENYVLVKMDGRYFVCNRVTNTLLLIEDEDLHEAIVNEMLKNQCEIVEES